MAKINKVFNRLEEYVAVSLLIFTSFLVFTKVVLRFVFNTSLYWDDEVARYLIIWFIFIGSSIAVRENAHATVDLVVTYLSQRWKLIVGIIAYVISVVFCVLLIISSQAAIENVMEYNSITPALGVPMYVPYLAIPFGTSLMLIRFIQAIVKNIKDLSRLNSGEGGAD